MAVPLINLVRRADAEKLGGPRNKFILFLIADNANTETRLAFPGVERLAHESGYSRTTVMLATDELSTLGVIVEVAKPNRAAGYARTWTIDEERLREIEGCYAPPRKGLKSGPKKYPSSLESGLKNVEESAESQVQNTEPLGLNDPQSQVQTPDGLGPGFRPQPEYNHNNKPDREPEPQQLKARKELVGIIAKLRTDKSLYKRSIPEKLYSLALAAGTDSDIKLAFKWCDIIIEHLDATSEKAVRRWLKDGRRNWNEEKFGEEPGHPGSRISKERLREIEIEMGVYD